MLFVEEDSLFIGFSASDDSSDDFLPGAVDLPHDFSLVSQHIKLTPIPATLPDLSEQDLFFIPDVDTVSCSSSMVHDSSSSFSSSSSSSLENPRKKTKTNEANYSPVSVCTIVRPFECGLPHPPIRENSISTTSRYYDQLANLVQRMNQSEDSRRKVAEYCEGLAHMYESMGRSESSLFVSSSKASQYQESRMALFSSLRQAMEESPPALFLYP